MDVLTTILTFCAAALGCSTLVGWLLYRKAMHRIKDAEALKAEADADRAQWERYEKQLDHSVETINKLQTQLEHYVDELNREQKDKTARIRGLTDELIQSQHALVEANTEITRLTEARDAWKALAALREKWVCHKNINTCGRVPPNDELAGQNYLQQERELLRIIKRLK